MASLNSVHIMGNLTRSPEVRYTTKGTAVGDVSLAINRQIKDDSGAVREEVTYVDVTVWGRQAETCKEFLDKGSSVFIEGRLQLEQWEKDGEKKSRLKVVAERVQFLSSPKGTPKKEEPKHEEKSNTGKGRDSDGNEQDCPF